MQTRAITSKKPLELASEWCRLMCWNWVRLWHTSSVMIYNIASSGLPLLPSPTCYNQNDDGHVIHKFLWESAVFLLFTGQVNTVEREQKFEVSSKLIICLLLTCVCCIFKCCPMLQLQTYLHWRNRWSSYSSRSSISGTVGVFSSLGHS